MVHQDAVEERFVPIVERRQIDVLLEVVRLVPVVFHDAHDLGVLAAHARRQESAKVERHPLLGRERGPLVQGRIVQEGCPPGRLSFESDD